MSPRFTVNNRDVVVGRGFLLSCFKIFKVHFQGKTIWVLGMQSLPVILVKCQKDKNCAWSYSLQHISCIFASLSYWHSIRTLIAQSAFHSWQAKPDKNCWTLPFSTTCPIPRSQLEQFQSLTGALCHEWRKWHFTPVMPEIWMWRWNCPEPSTRIHGGSQPWKESNWPQWQKAWWPGGLQLITQRSCSLNFL